MKDLVEYQNNRILALQKELEKYRLYLLEVTDKKCPNDYRRVIRTEILNN